MREGIGSIALYNIIMIFIFVTFAVSAGTMSYSKAFKVNNKIINAIEKYEGYSELTARKIDEQLLSIGYQPNDAVQNCAKRKHNNEVYDASDDLNLSYDFCVYQFPEDTREWKGRYSTYGVTSFINIDFPFFGRFFRIPVYGESKMVFSFDKENPPKVTNINASLSYSPKHYLWNYDIYFNYDGSLRLYQGKAAPDIKDLYDFYLVFDDGSSISVDKDKITYSGIQTYSIGPGEFTITYDKLSNEHVPYNVE